MCIHVCKRGRGGRQSASKQAPQTVHIMQGKANERAGRMLDGKQNVKKTHYKKKKTITREKYRKYPWKKSQVCHDILAILKSLRHHTCDFILAIFRVYLRFSAYLRFFVQNHTCDFFRKYASRNRKYGGPKGPLARNIASIPRLKSQVCQHYDNTKSQVW